MNSLVRRTINACFRTLVEKYGFRPFEEVNAGEAYAIKYVSSAFVVKLEKYRHEFYCTLCRPNDEDRQINLFNLLAYLTRSPEAPPSGEYFGNEENVQERYRKQLAHIAGSIESHFAAIERFFASDDYEYQFADVERFVTAKYPHLFRKT